MADQARTPTTMKPKAPKVGATAPVSATPEQSTLGNAALASQLGGPEAAEESSLLAEDDNGALGRAKLTPLLEEMKDEVLGLPSVYARAAELRVEGHTKYPGEANSEVRHQWAAEELARSEGEWTARAFGAMNEVQGFLWHDIWDLPGRLSGVHPWAFQLSDLVNNEVGIERAKATATPCPPSLSPLPDLGERPFDA